MLWIILILNFSIIFASHESTALHDNGTRNDAAIYSLAYSHPLYDNVGQLRKYAIGNNTGFLYDYKVYPSAVYIGGKTCLTSAHCEYPAEDHVQISTVYYEVLFEIKGIGRKTYKVEKFISHPNYKENTDCDLAVLILEKSVMGLEGFSLSSQFAKDQQFDDYQHLLTHIGYGSRILCNDYFFMHDNKRRAIRYYISECSIKPNNLSVYGTPFGQCNKSKTRRPLINYEVGSRRGMSGGAVLNINNELAAIISGTQFPGPPKSNYYYDMFIGVVNIIPSIINMCCCPFPFVNTYATSGKLGARARSVPIGVFRKWIEAIRRQYDDTYIEEYA